MPTDVRARLGQAELPNLVLAAAGCAGAGRELAQFVDVARVGALISKSVMAEPHTGNPAPRLAETPSGAELGGPAGPGRGRLPPAGPAVAAFPRRAGRGLDRRPDHPRIRRAG